MIRKTVHNMDLAKAGFYNKFEHRNSIQRLC